MSDRRPLDTKRPAIDDDWMGPDEEGDVVPPTGRPVDDSSAWVSADPARHHSDIYRNPAGQTGYTGDEDVKDDLPVERARERGLSAEENRGRRAPQHGTGVVVGSGAGAGGGGNDEDFDDDPVGGGGQIHMHPERGAPDDKADGHPGGSH